MKSKEERDIKQYLKEVRLYLPTFHKEEKRFIEDLTTSLLDFSISTKKYNKSLLIAEFGEPREVALNYISSQDAETLRKALVKNRYIKRSIIIALLLLFGFLQVKSLILYIDLKKSEDSYINREIIILEED